MVKHAGIHNREEVSLFDVLQSVKNQPDFPKAGALGVFVGVVRGETRHGQAVKKYSGKRTRKKPTRFLTIFVKNFERGLA